MATDEGYVPLLPDEILSLICQELGQDRDFGTLYNCALSVKSLADPALRTMYQYVNTYGTSSSDHSWLLATISTRRSHLC